MCVSRDRDLTKRWRLMPQTERNMMFNHQISRFEGAVGVGVGVEEARRKHTVPTASAIRKKRDVSREIIVREDPRFLLTLQHNGSNNGR